MSFSYGPLKTPPTWTPPDSVRLLLADTDPAAFVFSDEEIAGAFTLQASLNPVNVIGGGFRAGAYPPLPISPLRVAALLMDSLASNQARLQSVTKLLDVSLSPLTAKDLRSQSDAWRTLDDDSGGIYVIEQTTTSFAFRDRWFAQAQRYGQGVGGY
jgi:hypothetical protein